MSSFVMLIELHPSALNERLDARVRRAIDRRMRLSGGSIFHARFGPVSAFALTQPFEHSPIAIRGTWVALGQVRLDNRSTLAAAMPATEADTTDMDVVLRVLSGSGTSAAPRLEGDFGLVVVDTVSRRITAVRDAFGVRPLYYARYGGAIAFSSHADLITDGETYDLEYLTAFAAGVAQPSNGSAFAGVSAVPPASTLVVDGGRLTVDRYWSPFDREPMLGIGVSEAVEEFRSLFFKAVHLRLTNNADVWSELSGGLDSSSIVSVAQVLARAHAVPVGVSGTVTYVDTVGSGADERAYSDEVVRTYGVRSETFVDSVLWEDDDCGPPLTDAPDGRLLLYARDRRVATTIRKCDGVVLLSGLGSDHYLLGNMFFFADWLAAGRLREAVREMLRWAALGRVSFWKLAYLNAILPLLPERLQRRLVPEGMIPPWVPRSLVERFGLAERRVALRSFQGPSKHKYSFENALATASIAGVLDHGLLDEALDLRYPFLYRPLVDFALRLPHAFCAQPCQRKWILREALRDVLPESIRTRRWKGTFDGRSVWCLSRERDRIERMLRDPIAAQLGCIDPSGLRAAVMAESRDPGASHIRRAGVLQALALETWLLVRSGRWTASEGSADVRAPKHLWKNNV